MSEGFIFCRLKVLRLNLKLNAMSKSPLKSSSTKINYKAPDGGWGWVIVFGSFMISVLGDGFSYTSGIFYEKFLNVYGESEAITSMFSSIMTGMVYCAGIHSFLKVVSIRTQSKSSLF